MSSEQKEKSLISYQIRRVQIIDAVILAGIMATFATSWSTMQTVAELKAERVADEKIDARDPVIRQSRYTVDMSVIRSRQDSTEARVERLEKARQ